MVKDVKSEIIILLTNADVDGDIVLISPPNPALGDFTYACFSLAKEWRKNPAEVAKEIEEKIKKQPSKVIEDVLATGPYVNFFVKSQVLAKIIFKQIGKEKEEYGRSKLGKKPPPWAGSRQRAGKKILVEFGCPNPLKAFHLGHLRNLITGESVARILDNAGYAVKRVNYQGDVGLHVAKALWAIVNHKSEILNHKSKPIEERIAWLGQKYAEGAQAYEKDPAAKAEIEAMNRKVYEHDASIRELYEMTREWSLDYFDTIYKKLGTRYDRLYFESEVVGGKDIVMKYLAKGIFATGDGGAIIFPGSKFGLHDRVFVNSQGHPTYEAKELDLARLHFKEFSPDRVIHMVGKEQAEYFKVLFVALEQVFPKTKGKEFHLVGGYLQLKGDKKMSSRTGNVVTGDELVAKVEQRVQEIMREADISEKDTTAKIVAVAALKYAMLKSGVSNDISFDLEESVSTSGDSGPYLLYIVARIKSILKKTKKQKNKKTHLVVPKMVESQEKQLLLRLAEYPEITMHAAERLDPSTIAQYLFRLAQAFNTFYESCPVLQAEEESVKQFRLQLVGAVADVMTAGLQLLGIETVEEM